MRRLFLVAISCFMSVCGLLAAPVSYADYVNPLVGTMSVPEFSTGNTYPAIARPWGMNFWTPQTGVMGDGWIYSYNATKIRGFKQTHQPSPWINDYGQFAIMPVTGKPLFREDERASWFTHKAEVAKPYYYKVYLAEHDVVTELVPTERAAMFRFTFPENDSYIVVDALDRGSYIRIIPEQSAIVGYTTRNQGGVPENFKNYFVVKFDKPFTYRATFSNDAAPAKPTDKVGVTLKGDVMTQTAFHTGAIIGFHTHKGEVVHARVASSFISEEQALQNLKELGTSSFETLKEAGRTAWNKVLGRIEVSGGSDEQMRTFYSCLYRSLLFPRKLHEITAQGKTVHYSPYNGQVLPGYMYTDSGFWDTFRCLFPFLNLMYPSVNKEIQEALLNVYRESGFFPEWASPGHRECMVGNNSASILVDAYLKGNQTGDVNLLYEGLMHATNNVHPKVKSTGRIGHTYYNQLGYIPYNVKINENVARSLEYCYDDWCILQLAKKLGRPAEEIETLSKRALNYRNLFDKESRLMRGRNEDGTFQKPFSPLKWGDAFTEGNSWHYTWSVFHDPQGLIQLMGGDKRFVQMLDSVFTVPPVFDESYYHSVIHEIREMQVMNMGNYAHGNQPAQHMIYLYNYAGQPWKAQARLRQVMDRFYTAQPDGYCGDEDNGQTSAWYVFTALGFYPVCPATDQYVCGTPLFPKAKLHFENGKTLEINAPAVDDTHPYVESLQWAGKAYTHGFFTYGDLLRGGRMDYRMSDKPNTARGTAAADRPYSFSNER